MKKSVPGSAKSEVDTRPVWEAYSAAFTRRHGTDPVRNAKVNGQLAQLIGRLGSAEAPHVAAFFVEHQSSFYEDRMHAIDLLLKDAESLRTRWAQSQRATSSSSTAWLEGTGFASVYDAQSAGCGPGNAKMFRDGRKVVA